MTTSTTTKMFNRIILIFSIINFLLGCTTTKESGKLKKAEWLLGNWKGVANGQVFYENWQKISDTEFKNINYTICNGDTVVNSRSKIEIIDGKPAYTSGKLIWPLKSISDKEVIFENSKFNEKFTFRLTEKNEWYTLLEYPNSKTEYFIKKTDNIEDLLKDKPTPIVGHYEGLMTYENSSQEFSIDFDTLNNKEIAKYNIPANLQLNRPVINICNSNSSLSITFPDGRNDLTVLLDVKGNEMTGKLQGELPATIKLKKESNYQPAKRSYTIIDTILVNGSVKLKANIYLPTKVSKSPALVLISGTGQHTKEEYNGWADLLASNGIAVLSYDKRNVTNFPELNIRNATTDIGFITDLTNDAQKAVDLLKSLKEINQDKIGLLGFSQGAVVAPILAAQNKDIAFVVAISGNATTDKEFIINQELNRLEERNSDSKVKERANRIWIQLFDYAKTKSGGKEIQDELNKAYDEGWGSYCLPRDIPNQDELKYLMTWNSFELNPIEYWSELNVPCLVIYGESDRLIPVKESIELLSTTFKGKPQFLTIKVYPNADHSIKTIPNRNNFQFPHYADNYLNDLTKWIKIKTQ